MLQRGGSGDATKRAPLLYITTDLWRGLYCIGERRAHPRIKLAKSDLDILIVLVLQ